MRTKRNWTMVAALAFLAATPLMGRNPSDKPASDTTSAKIVITVKAKAELYVEGKKVAGTGKERTYTTPPLAAGKSYTYTVKSVREPNNYTTITRTRKVTVKAGETVKLDLSGPDDPKQPDAVRSRFVPTPMTVSEKMLELAKVSKNDVVFDIGCGDGRLVIMAVKKFKAKKGVGIDIDPELVKESIANAKEYGVSDKVVIRQEDALKVKNLEEATVVCLYMSKALMNQLHPIFKERLKPGTRIVSHRFPMTGWKADKTITFTAKNDDDEDEDFRLHLWTVPAKDKDKAKKKGR